MIRFLRLIFLTIIASMLWVTGRASLDQPLGHFVHSAAFHDPWVVATLFDAYWAFITFYIWVAWKEQARPARVLWFIAILLLGNLAMAAYMLAQLLAVPVDSPLDAVFTRRQPGRILLPGLLTALAGGIYLLA